jgi:hypothetical protein
MKASDLAMLAIMFLVGVGDLFLTLWIRKSKRKLKVIKGRMHAVK